MATLGLVTYETREVLGGSNKSKAALLTHTVKWSDLNTTETPLCSRVKASNIADKYSLSTAEREEAPTCPQCRARDPRFNEGR